MKEMEKSEKKIQKICEFIKNETLLPAKQQAKEIIQNAQDEAVKIIEHANKEKERLLKEASGQIEKEKKVFDSSIKLATKQALEDLKQKIEKNLFSENLLTNLKNVQNDPGIIANLITVIINAIEKNGLDSDISVYVSKNAKLKEISAFLAKNIIDKLKEKQLVIDDFDGGVKIKLHKEKVTIDVSSKSIMAMVAEFIKIDYRKLIFNE